MNRRDQIEAQGKPLSAIAVPFTQNTKHFQFAKNMFNQNSFTSQRFVSLFLPLGQWMILGFLERCLAVFMEFCESLVTSIC